MTAKEIFDWLLHGAIERLDPTCDCLISGEETKVVSKVATCFKLTAEVLADAIRRGFDMIITHEPTFSKGDEYENANPTDLKKWKLLQDSGITVYRFHDHAHHSEPDYIHAGFIRDLELDIKYQYPRESLGVCRYELSGAETVASIAQKIQDKLGVEFVRVVGNSDACVKTVCLGLGSVGLKQLEILHQPGCDLFITGEVGEVCACEYIRDACFFGDQKAVLILGHYSAEFSGMRFLAEVLDEKLVPAEYLDCGEVYHRF